jgi:multidrug efflux system membrane fusion protein
MDTPAAGRRLWSGGARRPLTAFLVLLLIALVVWGAWALSHRAGSGGPGGRFGRRGPPATTVGVAKAVRADVPIMLDSLGTVTPEATVTVRPQVSGTIVSILFREGQMVKRGQALAVIDPRPLQMALLTAQGQLARDQAQLSNAELTLKRYETLLAQDSIARQDVDTQAALVRQLRGTVQADQASVGTARLNLGYSRVIAPVSGRVGLRAVDVGNYISAGATNGIVVLTQIAPIDVEFTVPQDEVDQVQARAARSPLPVIAYDRTRTAELGQGRFSTLDNQVDTTTGTVRAKARFANADGELFPNQFVNVRLELNTLNNVVVVPPTAVRTGPNGQFVWLLQAGHTVTMRKVTTGPTSATETAITSGLQPSDTVITEGADRLTESARVQLPGERPLVGPGGRGGRQGGRGRHGERGGRPGAAGGR